MAKSFTIPSIFVAIDKFTSPMDKMKKSVREFGGEGYAAAERVERRFRRLDEGAMKVAKSTFIAGAAIAAPLVLAAREAVAFEDKLADVAKTTGLSGSALEDYGNSVLSMSGDTRTSIDDLITIGEIGGQLGIANDELMAFTDSVNQFNVALGSDFSGGVEEAVSAIGGLRSSFVETRNVSTAEAISRTGSAINELGAQGKSTTANISEFATRMGSLPDALKPTITDTLALGAFLEEQGLNAQIASGGLTNLFLVAAKGIPDFAKVMGMTAEEAKKLFESDPTAFIKKFAGATGKMSGTELANTLSKLGVGTQESIKVVGALSSGLDTLSSYQDLSSKSFKDGTSLQNEYNKKNNTTAAQLEKAQNNFKALSIIIGTQLLPVVSDLLKVTVPYIKALMNWTKENPQTTKSILMMVVGISALMFAISGASLAVSLYAKFMIGLTYAQKAVTFAQWLWNAAMYANPIGLIIIAIVAMIAVIIAAIAYWNDWGAAITLMLGPIGWIVSAIQSFRRNWDMIKASFADGGILEGLKAIGKTLLDAVLMPLQQIMEIAARITGADWAKNAAASIKEMRSDLGVNVTTDESGEALTPANPKEAEQDALAQKIQTVEKQKVQIDINDKNNSAKVSTDNNLVPIRLGSTLAFP